MFAGADGLCAVKQRMHCTEVLVTGKQLGRGRNGTLQLQRYCCAACTPCVPVPISLLISCRMLQIDY